MGFINSTELHEREGNEARFVSMIPDELLSLLVFPICFWLFPSIFMAFEKAGTLQQYRLRTPADAGKLNKATHWQCTVSVLGI